MLNLLKERPRLRAGLGLCAILFSAQTACFLDTYIFPTFRELAKGLSIAQGKDWTWLTRGLDWVMIVLVCWTVVEVTYWMRPEGIDWRRLALGLGCLSSVFVNRGILNSFLLIPVFGLLTLVAIPGVSLWTSETAKQLKLLTTLAVYPVLGYFVLTSYQAAKMSGSTVFERIVLISAAALFLRATLSLILLLSKASRRPKPDSIVCTAH